MYTHTTHYSHRLLHCSYSVHTSSSSFTLHLPLSRRDWTSCNFPSAAAISRYLSSEELAVACSCVMIEVEFIAGVMIVATHYLYHTIQSWFRVECTCKAEVRVRIGAYTVIIFRYKSNLQCIYIHVPMYILRNKATYASTQGDINQLFKASAER